MCAFKTLKKGILKTFATIFLFLLLQIKQELTIFLFDFKNSLAIIFEILF